MTKLVAMVVTLVLACHMSTLTASAQADEGGSASTSAAASGPRPKLDQFKAWVGVWKCKGQTYASSSLFGPSHPTRLSFTTTRELDGFCYLTRGGQKNFKLVQAIGFDASNKKLVEIGFDNLGGRWTETADGATPRNVVFSGKYTLNGNESAVRDTFSFKKREFSHLGEIQMGNEWKKLNEEKCTK